MQQVSHLSARLCALLVGDSECFVCIFKLVSMSRICPMSLASTWLSH